MQSQPCLRDSFTLPTFLNPWCGQKAACDASDLGLDAGSTKHAGLLSILALRKLTTAIASSRFFYLIPLTQGASTVANKHYYWP